MGQNIAPLGFGCRKNDTPFQGPYQGELKFSLNNFVEHMNNATVENRKIELLNGETFAISHEKRAQMRKLAIVRESPYHMSLVWGL